MDKAFAIVEYIVKWLEAIFKKIMSFLPEETTTEE